MSTLHNYEPKSVDIVQHSSCDISVYNKPYIMIYSDITREGRRTYTLIMASWTFDHNSLLYVAVKYYIGEGELLKNDKLQTLLLMIYIFVNDLLKL